MRKSNTLQTVADHIVVAVRTAVVQADSTQDEFVTRFDWRQDSIAFWDNRAVMHRAANDYPKERRLMHRITLKGVPLRGVSG